MNTEFDNEFKNFLGWKAYRSNGIIFIRSVFGLLFLILSAWCLTHVPSSFLYGITIIPLLDSSPEYDELYGTKSDDLKPVLEKVFDSVGNIMMYILALSHNLNYIQWIIIFITIAVPTWLFIKYWSEDNHSPNSVHY